MDKNLQQTQEVYKDEYDKCSSIKDFEKYYIKYRKCEDNPYLEKAKEHIENISKVPFQYVFLFKVLLSALLIGIGGALMYFIFQFDGEAVSTHFALILAALMLFSLVLLILGIVILIVKNSVLIILLMKYIKR